jgi:enamine deaminase RidA (YjgF/YER057c/UK114 family)
MTSGRPLQYVHHPDAPDGAAPLAVRAGDLVFVGGQMPVHPKHGLMPETMLSPGMPYHGSVIEKQLKYLYTNLDERLAQLGTSLKQIVKINSFHMHAEDADMALRVRRDWFDKETPPPSTLVFASELTARGARVLIDMINVCDDAALPKTSVALSKSPPIAQVKSIGWAVYSQVVKAGGLVFTRGTAPHNQDGPLPETLPDYPFPYDFEQVKFQLRYELERLKDLLADAGCSLKDVVRGEIHMPDMSNLAAVDEVWAEYFPVDPPARVILPLELVIPPMIIETGLIAVDPKGPLKKEVVKAKGLPASPSPESRAVKAGPYVFFSGLMATDYKNGLAAEARINPNLPYHKSSAALQAEYILKEVDALCAAAGTTPENIVKRRVLLSDLRDAPATEAVWRAHLKGKLPPTSILRTAGPFPVPECTVQYDLIAYAP